jgi:hypothetical protein
MSTKYVGNDMQVTSLADLGLIQGILSKIEAWAPGLVLAHIGKLKVILPEELRLKRFLNEKIMVGRSYDDYKVVRVNRSDDARRRIEAANDTSHC